MTAQRARPKSKWDVPPPRFDHILKDIRDAWPPRVDPPRQVAKPSAPSAKASRVVCGLAMVILALMLLAMFTH